MNEDALTELHTWKCWQRRYTYVQIGYCTEDCMKQKKRCSSTPTPEVSNGK